MGQVMNHHDTGYITDFIENFFFGIIIVMFIAQFILGLMGW